MRLRRHLLLWILLLAAPAAAENQVRMLPTPTEDVQARLKILKESDVIYLSTYILLEDKAGLAQLALLRQAAREGKRIRILWDGIGGKITGPMIRHLQQEGIEVKVYQPPPFSASAPFANLFRPSAWFHRSHDKLFIGFKKDGSGSVQVVAGSRNQKEGAFGLGDHPSREFGIYVEGAAAEDARQYYERVWNTPEARLPRPFPARRSAVAGARERLDQVEKEMARWPAFAAGKGVFEREPPVETSHITFIHDDPKTQRGSVEPIVRLIDSAKSEIVATSPYLVPPPELEAAFRRARERGVKVTILTNSRASTNVPLAQAGYENVLPKYLAMGIEVREPLNPHLIHKKLIAVDGERVFVGSFNLDWRSADSNLESGFIIEGARFHDWVTDNVRRDLKRSVAVTGRPPAGSCFWGFLRLLARPLEPVL